MITAESFGKTKDGRKVTRFVITNQKGARLALLNYGAIIQEVSVPDKNGVLTDVMLGFDDIAGYEVNRPHFGAVIGRNGNRIAGGKFTLNGQEISLAVNETARGNNLHSGPDFYEHRMYEASVNEKNDCVSFRLDTPDGDQGFPGRFTVTVTYMLTAENKVKIHYEGSADKDTVANMTNHSYWNLNGESDGSVMDHLLEIRAQSFTPVDAAAIPTGEIKPVEGTPFDFRSAKPMSRDAETDCEQLKITSGYDHNFVLDGDGLREVASVTGEKSGIVMRVLTDLPGMQLYAGNFVNVEKGKGGKPYGPHAGLALETQYHPNSVNIPAFESPVLKAGERYSTTTCYRFGLA